LSTSDPAATADRIEIIELTGKLALKLDARDWDAVKGLFTEQVYSDRTSLFGGEPMTLSVDDFVAGWSQSLDGLEVIHHLIGNHVITLDGDQATCTAGMQGVHMLHNPTGDDSWNVGGHHIYQLERTADGWRISGLTFNIQWATGNMNIVALSAAAAAAGGE
jgi:SnoaL-like domain